MQIYFKTQATALECPSLTNLSSTIMLLRVLGTVNTSRISQSSSKVRSFGN